ncbi:hypothetical protein ACLKA6_008399 [Drosophila palustris]
MTVSPASSKGRQPRRSTDGVENGEEAKTAPVRPVRKWRESSQGNAKKYLAVTPKASHVMSWPAHNALFKFLGVHDPSTLQADLANWLT